jgi:hypothetical protein
MIVAAGNGRAVVGKIQRSKATSAGPKVRPERSAGSVTSGGKVPSILSLANLWRVY